MSATAPRAATRKASTATSPHDDQWALLSSIDRVAPEAAHAMATAFGELATGPDASTYRRPRGAAGDPKPPAEINASTAAMLAIDRIGVPPALLADLKHIASLHNPEFYEKEKLRFSTWNTPRFIRCYRETLDRLLLPRGLRDRAAVIVSEAGSRLSITDRSPTPDPIEVTLRAVLTPAQAKATEALAGHDLGMLVAPPGAGKTVVGCAAIAQHSLPTLVIVDRKPLVEQWRSACHPPRTGPEADWPARGRPQQSDGDRRRCNGPEPRPTRRSGEPGHGLWARDRRRVPPRAGGHLRAGRAGNTGAPVAWAHRYSLST